MTPTSVLTLNPENKQQIDTYSAAIVEKVKNGELGALQTLIRCKAVQKASEMICEQIRSEVMNEADRYSEKRFNAYGSEIEKVETGIKYDFSSCGDPSWAEAAEQEKEWKKKREEREKFLKTLTKPMAFCDESTGGETIELRPPVKTSTSFIKVTHK